MVSLLSHSASDRQVAKFSHQACVNHELQCVKCFPAPQGTSLVKIRTLTEKYATRDWLLRITSASGSGGAFFSFQVAERDVSFCSLSEEQGFLPCGVDFEWLPRLAVVICWFSNHPPTPRLHDLIHESK